MIENREVMAKNIKFYMNEKGVSAAEICRALDLKPNTFSDWIHAKTYPRIDYIQKMADYFGISIAFLVEEIVPVSHFTPEEVDMILSYRNADSETQTVIKRLLRYGDELKRTEK